MSDDPRRRLPGVQAGVATTRLLAASLLATFPNTWTIQPHPGDGTTVTAVAARWGFASPSQFAGRYRRTYGQLPSHTLRG